MPSPVNGTAPTSVPGRSTLPDADRLRRLIRRLALVAAAVGGGVLLALLFQGPARADGARSGAGEELHRQIGALMEPVRRVTVTERPYQDPRRDTRADDRRSDGRRIPLTGAVVGAVGARDVPPPSDSRRPPTAGRVAVPPLRLSVPAEATRHARLRPPAPARATHRPAQRARAPRVAADSTRRPSATAPGHPGLIGPIASPAVTGPLTAGLRPAVGIVRVLPIEPVRTALLRVVHVVLPLALGEVIAPAWRSPIAPPLGPAAAPVPIPPPAPAPPTPPPGLALSPVCAPTAPSPAAPPPRPAPVGTRPTAPPAHLVAHPAPPPVDAYPPGQPVGPVDSDAAGVDEGSAPAPGLIRPAHRQSHPGIAALCHLVPLSVESRTPSGIARPG
ncbi:hypothetical protein [Micromonospora sp. NPDC049102]|uniref:hypothetical protein n=1 Tax=Micromonospora sp. NPDC049102 TaxID=3364265 RepID=UPI0037111684